MRLKVGSKNEEPQGVLLSHDLVPGQLQDYHDLVPGNSKNISFSPVLLRDPGLNTKVMIFIPSS
jgi:hypothetical protein